METEKIGGGEQHMLMLELSLVMTCNSTFNPKQLEASTNWAGTRKEMPKLD